MFEDKMSALEGYMLGRMAEQGQQETVETARHLAERLSGRDNSPINVTELLEENARLRRNLAIAREDFRKLAAVYDALDEWANNASATMRQHGLIRS